MEDSTSHHLGGQGLVGVREVVVVALEDQAPLGGDIDHPVDEHCVRMAVVVRHHVAYVGAVLSQGYHQVARAVGGEHARSLH
jgi:hypothetical protein